MVTRRAKGSGKSRIQKHYSLPMAILQDEAEGTVQTQEVCVLDPADGDNIGKTQPFLE